MCKVHIFFISQNKNPWNATHTRIAKVVTSLRTKYLHKSGLILSTDTILGHSLYDLGQGIRNTVICALICRYGTQCFTACVISIVSWFLQYPIRLFNTIQIKAVLHARVVKIICCRIVGLMLIGAYTDYWQDHQRVMEHSTSVTMSPLWTRTEECYQASYCSYWLGDKRH